MFLVSALEDDVRVQPSDLTKAPLDAVTEALEHRFLDKVRSLCRPGASLPTWAWAPLGLSSSQPP